MKETITLLAKKKKTQQHHRIKSPSDIIGRKKEIIFIKKIIKIVIQNM